MQGCPVIAAEAAIQESPGLKHAPTECPSLRKSQPGIQQRSVLDTGLSQYNERGCRGH